MFSRISSIFIISIMLIGLGGVYQAATAVTPTVLVQGAPIQGADGMDWGSDGFLYGPIVTKGQVVRVNVDTGEITPVSEGLGAPNAVRFDSSGLFFYCRHRCAPKGGSFEMTIKWLVTLLRGET